MRKLVLGMLLAAGAALPTMAMAAMAAMPQDEGHRPDNPRKWAGDQHGEPPVDGARRQDQPRAAPQSAPAQPRPQQQQQPQPQVQGRVQAQGGARGDGARFGGNGDGRFDAGQNGRGQGQPQGYRRDDQFNRGVPASQDYRRNDAAPNRYPDRGGPQPGYRGFQGGAAQGPGGYRPQDYGRGPAPQYRPGPGGPQPRQGGNWSRGWRDDHRYDWGRYRAENRAAFHLPRYYAPPGWQYGYRRFSPGFTLSFELFDRGFWIDDAYAYRLPPAQWPYQWVRYYNDALLVDVRSGYVVDTVHDIFW